MIEVDDSRPPKDGKEMKIEMEEEIKPTGESRQTEIAEPGFTRGPLKTQSREVQCADCLAWINTTANHTCRQQVRRNQRSARR